MLKITLKTFRGYIAVVMVQGRLVLGEMDKLRSTIQTTIDNDYRRIVIDLGDVDKIDCAGLGELVSYYTKAREAGIFVGLTNLTSRMRDLLVITKLATIFPIIDNEVFSTQRPKQWPPSTGPGWWQQFRRSHRDRRNTSV
jgi:anti-sigma B factor antagonist